MAGETVVLVQWKGGRQTDSMAGTGKDGGAAAEDEDVWLVKNLPEKP